jgi:hypothetical protein
VRDYRADEWLTMLDQAGFEARIDERWRIGIEFAPWVERMRTPDERVAAIRSLWQRAPDEVRRYFDVRADGSFKLDVVQLSATRRA